MPVIDDFLRMKNCEIRERAMGRNDGNIYPLLNILSLCHCVAGTIKLCDRIYCNHNGSLWLEGPNVLTIIMVVVLSMFNSSLNL